MLKIKDETGTYVELPRDKITFYGDTEKERKANEQLFDISLELSGLYDENEELKQQVDRLNEELGDANYTITQLHKVMDRHYVKKEDYDRLINIIEELEQYCLDAQIPDDYPEYNEFVQVQNMAYEYILNKLKELKEGNKDERN